MKLPVHIGEIVANKYRIERLIGSGGMGVVVEARHVEIQQRVALKFLQTDLAYKDASARFRNEARALARLSTEHVTRIIDFGELESGVPYIVMEYLDGHDLASEIRDRKILPAQVAVDYVLQAIEALAEAHANGIIHRDLKPGNLFLARRADGSIVVKLLDFGVAKTLAEQGTPDLALTQVSMQIGSPHYMSPEQMRSAADVDPRSDVWALGVILYRVLTGQAPFNAASFSALRHAIETEEAPQISELNPEVPPGLVTVIMRCLAKEPKLRFASVAELGTELCAFGSPGSQVHVERAVRVQAAIASIVRVPSQILELSDSDASEVEQTRHRTLAVISSSAPSQARSLSRTHGEWVNSSERKGEARRRLWSVPASVVLALGTVLTLGFVARHVAEGTRPPLVAPGAQPALAAQIANPAPLPRAAATGFTSSKSPRPRLPAAPRSKVQQVFTVAPASIGAAAERTQTRAVNESADDKLKQKAVERKPLSSKASSSRKLYALPNFGGRH